MRSREERIIGYHARRISLLLARHFHDLPGPCPACVLQVEGIAELVPGVAVERSTIPPVSDHACALDCPYCHMHVVDVYSHLKYAPCAGAQAAADQCPDCGAYGPCLPRCERYRDDPPGEWPA
jgi:hypothetical protein